MSLSIKSLGIIAGACALGVAAVEYGAVKVGEDQAEKNALSMPPEPPHLYHKIKATELYDNIKATKLYGEWTARHNMEQESAQVTLARQP